MRLTAILIVASILALGGYDVWAFIHGGYPATISAVLLSSAKDTPLVSFAFGVLMGHLFWPQKGA